jgi:glycosyltransferase involved in cell wall biosynthesis
MISILFWLFTVAVFIQYGFALFFLFVKQKPLTNTLNIQPPQPVSVIICAKNEADNLQQNLPSILAQRYKNGAAIPFYEVIVVNDCSTDATSAVLNQFCNTHQNLRAIHINPDAPRSLPGKKHALNVGVNAAQNDWLLFTDADCKPADEDWIGQMTGPFRSNKQIVVGYGKYNHAKGLLNAFTRWETIHTFLQYSSYTKAGRPYMAVGRNLACTKNIWLKAQEAHFWTKLPSGDDDLLMQAMANRENTAIIDSPHSFTLTNAKTTWTDWMRQKQRHMSTGKYYKPVIKGLLSIYASSHALVWLLFPVLVCLSYQTSAVIAAMLARCILLWSAWAITSNKLQEKGLVFYFPFFDFGWMIYNFAFSPYIIWKNKKQWT